MKCIFLDTNIFHDAITSNDGGKILKLLSKQLKSKSIRLVLPEVIKVEILTVYEQWKRDMLNTVKGNLATTKILGIEEYTEREKDKKPRNRRKRENESEKIDSIINPDREAMIKKIETHYESMSKNIEDIFSNKHTCIVTLTDQILLNGMKRSALKKPPYTSTEKSTENPHVKDIDCIAFESLVYFCTKEHTANKKAVLVMCVSDKDYIGTNGELHADLKSDIKMRCNHYKDISAMLKTEFKEKIAMEGRKEVGIEGLTLSPQSTGIAGSSQDPLTATSVLELNV